MTQYHGGDNKNQTVDGINILLVEDNPINQKLTKRLLEKRRHKVEVACNGRVALEILDRKAYDLILMDIQMPEMDGLSATKLIRAKERQLKRRTPIIALTANVMNGDKERCLASGMDGYLSKPLMIVEAMEMIEKLVKINRTLSSPV